MADSILLTWTFISKAEPTKDLLNMLVEGEVIMHCYKTVRDIAALTNKRLIIRDAQGLTGKKLRFIHYLLGLLICGLLKIQDY